MDDKEVKAAIDEIQPTHIDNHSISSIVACAPNNKIGQQDTYGESDANAVSIEGTNLHLSK
jgi:hypothetical protein